MDNAEINLARAKRLVEQFNTELGKNQLYLYEPYQKQLDFHNTLARERCFLAANQTGKTYGAGGETAYHLTGLYPKWWKGRRFSGGIKFWVSGVTGLATRDTVQRIMLGMPDNLGSGMIPGDRLQNAVKATHGAAGLMDYAEIVSSSGDSQATSYIYFKSYEQGRMKWQAESVEGVWFDEEPPLDIYIEGLTRTNARDGFVFLTFTPLLGMSQVVRRFLKQPTENRKTIHMDISDAGHYTKKQIDAIIESYPEHEREARAHGRPVLGSGAVFPVLEAGITVPAFPIPEHWPRIAGIDFGWEHPTAVVWLAHDRETDTVYIYDCYKARKKVISQHASAIKARGEIPVAWPHDGMVSDRQSGEPLIMLYRKEGVTALDTFARYEDTRGNSLEASVADLHNRMETGRLKVFAHLDKWFEEFRMYHREQGKIVCMDDDAMSATRYAIMMLGRARTSSDYSPEERIDRYAKKRNNISFMGM